MFGLILHICFLTTGSCHDEAVGYYFEDDQQCIAYVEERGIEIDSEKGTSSYLRCTRASDA